MRLKTNVIISAVFLALLGFVYFYEIKGGEERRAETERAKQLVDFGDHEVSRLVVDRGDTALVLEKADGRWVVREPVEADADGDAVDRYLRNLRETEMEKVVADSAAVAADPALPAKYGLAEPRLRVLVELADTPLDTIRFGDDTPTERYTYGQRGGAASPVFAARAWRFDNLDKGLFDLRDRRVLAFDRDAVRQIRLERSWEEKPLVLARAAGGDWALVEPLAAAADQVAVNAMVSRLANGKAERFAAEAPDAAQLTESGLTPEGALIRLSLLLGDDRAEKRLTIGYEEADGRHFALDASRAPILVVDSTLVGKLRVDLFELRDRRPLRHDADAVTQVTLSRPGEPDLVAARDTADASVWYVTSPQSREARAWRLTSLLSDLDGMEVKAFVADGDGADGASAPGLAEPRLTVTVERIDGEPLTVRFGDEIDDEVYVACGRSVYRVAATSFDQLNLTLDDVAQPVPEPAGDAAGNSAPAGSTD